MDSEFSLKFRFLERDGLSHYGLESQVHSLLFVL